MISQRHVDARILEEFIRLARRQFAMIPVGVAAGVVGQVFRRAMIEEASKFAMGLDAVGGEGTFVDSSDQEAWRLVLVVWFW